MVTTRHLPLQDPDPAGTLAGDFPAARAVRKWSPSSKPPRLVLCYSSSGWLRHLLGALASGMCFLMVPSGGWIPVGPSASAFLGVLSGILVTSAGRLPQPAARHLFSHTVVLGIVWSPVGAFPQVIRAQGPSELLLCPPPFGACMRLAKEWWTLLICASVAQNSGNYLQSDRLTTVGSCVFC